MFGLATALLPTIGVVAQPTAPAALAVGYAYPERDIRLRAEPTSRARTVSSVPRNYPVRVSLCERGWCEVEYVGVRGYVRDDLLRFADVPSPSLSQPTLPPSQDSQAGTAIGTEPDASPAVQPAAMVEPRALAAPSTAGPVTASPSPAERWVGYLLADKVYRKPDAFADEVTTVSRRDRVRIVPLADHDGWYEVYLVGAAEPVGYAYTPYLSRSGVGEGTTPPGGAQ